MRTKAKTLIIGLTVLLVASAAGIWGLGGLGVAEANGSCACSAGWSGASCAAAAR